MPHLSLLGRPASREIRFYWTYASTNQVFDGFGRVYGTQSRLLRAVCGIVWVVLAPEPSPTLKMGFFRPFFGSEIGALWGGSMPTNGSHFTLVRLPTNESRPNPLVR
jgi:hypothetical protein